MFSIFISCGIAVLRSNFRSPPRLRRREDHYPLVFEKLQNILALNEVALDGKRVEAEVNLGKDSTLSIFLVVRGVFSQYMVITFT